MVFGDLSTAVGVLGLPGLVSGNAVAVARVSKNMRFASFTEDEVTRMLKALYLTGSKQDAREAWAVLDRRHPGLGPTPRGGSKLVCQLYALENTQSISESERNLIALIG